MSLAISNELIALLERQSASRTANLSRRPASFEKPPYGTREYFEAVKWGWVSEPEFEADERAYVERSSRAKAATGRKADQPARYDQPAPAQSRQYANQMATTAARDRRLVPEAKALLTILRARCGRGTKTETTKTTLAAIMKRHPRSIQRYLADLIRFGYITTTTRRGTGGLYSGLIVMMTEAAMPFYAKAKELAGWLAATADIIAPLLPMPRRFPDRTGLSPKNEPYKDSSSSRSRRAA